MPQSAFYLLPVTALPDLLNDRCVDQPEYYESNQLPWSEVQPYGVWFVYDVRQTYVLEHHPYQLLDEWLTVQNASRAVIMQCADNQLIVHFYNDDAITDYYKLHVSDKIVNPDMITYYNPDHFSVD